jgi:hypothetical protein
MWERRREDVSAKRIYIRIIRDHSKWSECPTCKGRTFFTFSTIISPLCVKDCKCTWGNLMAVTKKGPALAQSSLWCFGRIIMANWPTYKLAVTGSGGSCTALRNRYCLWAARAALWASCTCRCTAEAYCWAVEIVGSGTADIISDGGEVPNIRRYGAQPILRA